jgi:pimeloyl-ACP methyl ester carboxylesterase
VCIPGGPGRASSYLGDLGGLSGTRRLIQLDLRGTGGSPRPARPEAMRVANQVRDVEALRLHLRLERMDLLAHSAGAVLGTLYAAAHPERIGRLALITPGLAALGVDRNEAESLAVLRARATEPWFPTALAGFNQILAGDLSLEPFGSSRPLFYANWNTAAQAHAQQGVASGYQAAREAYFAGFDTDPGAVHNRLAGLDGTVLLYGGELDPHVTAGMLAQAAEHFPRSVVSVQPGAAHFPWVEDGQEFADALGAFLDTPVRRAQTAPERSPTGRAGA